MRTLDKSANIFLVGLMGAGKSSLGRYLAQSLSLIFFDADQEIEIRAGMSVSTIFMTKGEPDFRLREQQVIAELTKKRGIVLATGGGAVLNSANCQNLVENGIVIYLHAPIEQLAARTRLNNDRPLLRDQAVDAVLAKLQKERQGLYQQIADFSYDSSQVTVEQLGNQIKVDLQQHHYFER